MKILVAISAVFTLALLLLQVTAGDAMAAAVKPLEVFLWELMPR